MILIDEPRWQGFAHLVSDVSFDELHAFVASIELRARFHRDHYDVAARDWQHVVDAGAHVVSTKEIVRRLRGTTSAGSARRRRGE